MRKRIGYWLRRLADHIDYRGAPRHTHLSFTFEYGVGLVVHDDGRGCHLWYLGMDEYERAHLDGGEAPFRAELRAPRL